MQKNISLWRALFIVLVFVCQVSCGSAASVVSQATSTSTGGVTADTLSDTESQLFSDGPVELPVTIAKLDSPDMSLITVTVEALPAELVQFATAATHRFTVTGATGAGGKLSDGTFAPKFFVFNATTDEQSISDVSADGSFVGTIDGTLTDTIVLASMTQAEDQVSPILALDADADGNFAVTTTNTSNLVTDQNVMTDSLGNYYFSIANADGTTYTLIQRNLDGSSETTISSSVPSLPRMIMAVTGTNVTVVLQDGSVVLFTSSVAALVKDLAGGGVLWADVSWDSQTLDSIASATGTLVDPDVIVWPGVGLVYSSTESWAAVSVSSVNSGGDILRMVSMTEPGVSYTLAAMPPYGNAYIDGGEDGSLYVFLSMATTDLSTETFSLYRMSFPDAGDSEAQVQQHWTDREELIAMTTSPVYNMDVDSEAGLVAYTYRGTNGLSQMGYRDPATGDLHEISDPASTEPYIHAVPKVAPGGTFIIECTVSNSALGGTLEVYFPGDPAGTFHPLFSSDAYTTCTNNPSSYFIDSQSRIHFFKKPAGGTDADSQLSFIDPRQNSVFDGISLPSL